MRFRFSRYFFPLFGIAFTTGLASHSLYAQSNIQNIYVSPSGQGARTGNEQNAFSFEQALNHMRANSERFVSYYLLPGNYGDRDIALAESPGGGNRAWKTFVGDNANFGKLQLLRASGSPIGTKGLIGFHRVNIREAIVELNQVFFLESHFSGGALSGPYVNASSYPQKTGLVMNANYVAAAGCTFRNYLNGVVMNGINFLISNDLSYISEDAIRFSSAVDPVIPPQFIVVENTITKVGANHNGGAGHPDYIQGFARTYDSPSVYIVGNIMTNTNPDGSLDQLWTQGLHFNEFNPGPRGEIVISRNIIDTRHNELGGLITGTALAFYDSARKVRIEQNTLLGASVRVELNSSEEIGELIYRDNISSASVSKIGSILSDVTNNFIGSGWVSPSNYVSPGLGESPTYRHCAVEFRPGTFIPYRNQTCSVLGISSIGRSYVGAVPPS